LRWWTHRFVFEFAFSFNSYISLINMWSFSRVILGLNYPCTLTARSVECAGTLTARSDGCALAGVLDPQSFVQFLESLQPDFTLIQSSSFVNISWEELIVPMKYLQFNLHMQSEGSLRSEQNIGQVWPSLKLFYISDLNQL